ncbi:uncharacterized protein LOC127262468 [Andrographis paniculata]|uniref:uncharacterized protein LOC127262468 n=1 Tax=Andrographis paniculata TaxID=175694 RepID=UPI0021E8C748|nr:uncharacterized protein LOC127262468 [Andrographis paniculata]
MSESETPLRRASAPLLYKQNSWSPDILRDEAWANRRINQRLRRGRSVTEDDLDELRGCLDLGFDFDSPVLDPKLSSTFPALPFYYAVNKRCSNSLPRSASSLFSDSETASSFAGSPPSIIDPGEEPKMVKARLRQWAQLVACSVRQFSPN